MVKVYLNKYGVVGKNDPHVYINRVVLNLVCAFLSVVLGGRGVVGSWVRGSLVGGLVLGVHSLAGVSNVSDVAVVVVGGVGDGLGAAIGQVDGVGASDILAVSGLGLGKVGARVVVVDSVLEGVWLGGLVVVSGGGVVDGGGVVGRGGGVVGWGVVDHGVVGHGGSGQSGGEDGTDHLEVWIELQ